MAGSFFFRPPKDEPMSVKAMLIATSILCGFLTSGIVYGYSGLIQPLAVDAKAFIETCSKGDVLPCAGQTRSLTAAYTLSAATIAGSALLVGVVLDAIGPRWTSCIGGLLFGLGLVCFALGELFSSNVYYAAFFLLSFGGPTMLNSMMNFADLCPTHAALVMSAQNGAFDASAFVMFLMGKAVTDLHFTLSQVMLTYLVVPLGIIIISIFLFPDRPYGGGHEEGKATKGELWRVYMIKQRVVQQGEGAVEEADAAKASGSLSIPLLGESGVPSSPPDLYNTDISKQLTSPVFILSTIVSAYLMMRSNFIIASVFNQALYIAGNLQDPPFSDSAAAAVLANQYVDIFNYILPLGGLAMVPVVGWIMVRLGMTTSFFCIGILCLTVTGVQMSTTQPLALQMAAYALYACCRPYIFSAAAAFIAMVFGFRNFGRLLGMGRLAGAAATILQYPVMDFVQSHLNGDFFYVNCGFLTLELLMTILFPLYLWKGVFFGLMFRPPLEDLEAIEEQHRQGEMSAQ